MAKSLTSGNSIILLVIPGVYSSPVQLRGYAADDIFDTDSMTSVETAMGLDGRLSGGFVPAPSVMNITLQADSDSIPVFERWHEAMRLNNEVIYANGIVSVPAVERKYQASRGLLTSFSPTPSAKRILQPRRFAITWEKLSPGDL